MAVADGMAVDNGDEVMMEAVWNDGGSDTTTPTASVWPAQAPVGSLQAPLAERLAAESSNKGRIVLMPHTASKQRLELYAGNL